MSKDISSLELPLQRVLDLGKIDGWLRGVVQFVPKAGETGQVMTPVEGMEVIDHGFKTHTTLYDTLALIKPADIEKMVGFRQLIVACNQANVRIDIALLGQGALEVAFDAQAPFKKSSVFGASYANVLPVLFRVGDKPMGTKN